MQTVLLVIALSVDVFMASMACGAERIIIGKKTALCISGICSGVLFLSLMVGDFLEGVLSEQVSKWVCFLGLFVMGVFKLLGHSDPTSVDKDHSLSMSVTEGVVFALTMSVDGFFGGLGASLLELNIWVASTLNFVLSFVSVGIGSCLGKRIVSRQEKDISWVSGVLFLCLAFGKII